MRENMETLVPHPMSGSEEGRKRGREEGTSSEIFLGFLRLQYAYVGGPVPVSDSDLGF